MLTPARETKKTTTDAGTDEERPDFLDRVFFRLPVDAYKTTVAS